MKVIDLLEGETSEPKFLVRDDEFSSWTPVKLNVKSVNDIKDLKSVERFLLDYFGAYEWGNPKDIAIALSEFTILDLSDVKDDYIKFSVRVKTVYDGDKKSKKNTDRVKKFTISHDE